MRGPKGERGEVGPAGPSGAVSFSGVLAETVSAWHAVVSDGAERLMRAQPVAGLVVLGISLNAGNEGDTVPLIRTGVYSDPAWNWVVTSAIVLGLDGLMTQTLPAGAEVLQTLAYPVTHKQIIVRFERPILMF